MGGARGFVGLFWIYWVSCICQLFLNLEISRYTIATGETVLLGFTRLRPAKVWAWVSADFCWVQVAWPAWITGAAAGAAGVLGFGTWQAWSVVALAAVFLTFALSRYVYSTLEKVMYAAFLVANLGLGVFTVLMATPQAAADTARGWAAVGLIPAGVTLSMIGPFLLQPAGGFWNFWHTYWVRERGIGMGRYFGRATGLVTTPEEIRRTGYIVDASDPREVGKFRFTSFGIILIFALFDSQFSIYDGIARMWADTFYLEHPERFGARPYRFWYVLMLGALVVYGLIGLLLETPYIIWLVSNWLGTAAQAYITIMVLVLNRKLLPAPLRPGRLSVAVNALWAAVLIGYFVAWTVVDIPFVKK